MANTTLTPTAVTREALRILHQKLNFVGTINRSYDSSFGKSGAKNSAILAVQILATSDDELAQKLKDYKSNMREEVLEKDKKLNS